MPTSHLNFWPYFKSRSDLAQFGNNALMLLALELRFGIDDIVSTAANSITDGDDDKKADLIYIDTEGEYAVIAQAYMSQDMSRKEAKANKASDLNTATSWILNRPISELPINLQPLAEELRKAILDDQIKTIYIWYVHNLPESINCQDELSTVELTAGHAVKVLNPSSNIGIQAWEVGTHTIETWYHALSTPILVSDKFTIPIDGGFEIQGNDWQSYITAIPAKWLHQQFSLHKTDLFSANIRDYLGSRKADQNINHGIRTTAAEDPSHFVVYNNGITALVHSFSEIKQEEQTALEIKGISIINGAQTTGAIGNLDLPPADNALVSVRFITCSNQETLRAIVKYNNSQNKTTAPDFRSNDSIQRRLDQEFQSLSPIEYTPRRGGYEDAIRRSSNILPSVTAGQALAAFHGAPHVAYHQKTKIWEDDLLYFRFFNEHTTAKHIFFAYSLLRSIENAKIQLLSKSKTSQLTGIEESQLAFLRKRGSTCLFVSSISKTFEIILNKSIPNLFSLQFSNNHSFQTAEAIWKPIIDIACSFTDPLSDALADGIKNESSVQKAISMFCSLINSVKQANQKVFSDFGQHI